MNKKKEIIVPFKKIENARMILLGFGIAIENEVHEGDSIKAQLNGWRKSIQKAENMGYIKDGIFI